MAEKRGLNYIVETRANLGGLDRFLGKINQVEKAWKSLKDSTGTIKVGATQNNIDKIGKSVPKLKAASKYLKSISLSIASINRQSGSIGRVFGLVEKKTKAASRSVRRLDRDLSKAKSSTNGVARAAGSLASSLKRAAVISARILAIYAGFQAIKAVLGSMQQAVVSAFKFSDSIEKAELGIRSLLFSMLDVRDAQGEILQGQEAFAATTAEAKEQVRQLRIEGLRTSATFQQLVDTFQTALGPGLAAGLSLPEIRRVTVLISQAATAIGVPQEQLAEEIRSLLTGTGTLRTTRIAKAVLDIKKADVDKAKADGTFFEFIQDKLEGFGIASTDSLDLLSTKLINLADIAKQTLAEGLVGSFEKVKDVADELSEFFGQGKDADFITLNPAVVELFERVDAIMQSLIDSAVEFGRSFDLESAGDALEGFAFIGGLIGQVGIAFAELAVTVAKLVGFFGNIIGFLDNFLPITAAWKKLWQIILITASALLIKMTFIKIQALLTTATLAVQKALLPIIMSLWLRIGAELLVINTTLGKMKVFLLLMASSAKAAIAAIAPFVIPFLAILAALATVLTYFDDEFRPALVEGFKAMWRSISLGAQLAFAQLQNKLLKTSAKIKDFFGVDLLSVKSEEAIENQKELVEQLEAGVAAVAQYGESSGFDTGFFSQENLDNAKDKLKQLETDAGKISLEAKLKELEKEIEEKAVELVDAAGESRLTGKQGLDQVKDTIKLKLSELIGITGDPEETEDLTTFTAKFKEAESAFQAMADAYKDADKKLTLEKAKFGLEGIRSTAAEITAKLDETTQSALDAGNVMRDKILKTLNEIESKDPDLITKKDLANAKSLGEQLLTINKGLSTIKEVSDSTALAQLAVAVQTDRQRRLLKVRAAEEELQILRKVASVRQQMFAGEISEQQAAIEMRLISDTATYENAKNRLELDRQFLMNKSAEADSSEEANVFMDAATTIQAELNQLYEKGVLSQQEITEELRKQQLLQERPVAFGQEQFLDSLGSKQDIIAKGTQDLLQGFNDGLVNVLGDSLVDALFSKENTLREKWEALMQDLAGILIKTFLQEQIADIFLQLASVGAGDAGGGGAAATNGQAAAKSGIFNRGGLVGGSYAASPAHYGSKAQAFAKGGRPAGVPASDTVPAWLTPGEWVTKLSSARMYGDQVMSMINSGSINPIALKTLAAASGRTRTRRKAFATTARGYASGGSVASGMGGGSGGTTIINSLDEESLAVLLAGKNGERVIHNHLLNLGVLR